MNSLIKMIFFNSYAIKINYFGLELLKFQKQTIFNENILQNKQFETFSDKIIIPNKIVKTIVKQNKRLLMLNGLNYVSTNVIYIHKVIFQAKHNEIINCFYNNEKLLLIITKNVKTIQVSNLYSILFYSVKLLLCNVM